MRRSVFEEELKQLHEHYRYGVTINGATYDTEFKWANLIPNCGRAEVYRRLWYQDGKRKVHIPRGICFDAAREGVLYPRDGGISLAWTGWNNTARYSHHPTPIICGRFKYGKNHPKDVVLVPPLNLDGSTFTGGTRDEHLKAILNGLAEMCNDAFAGKTTFRGSALIEELADALKADTPRREQCTDEEYVLKARIILGCYLDWYEGWTKAGQPIEPEVED